MPAAPTQPCSRHLQPTSVSSSPSHHLAPKHQGAIPKPPPHLILIPALQLDHLLPTPLLPLTSLLLSSFLPQHQPPRSLSLLPLKPNQSVSLLASPPLPHLLSLSPPLSCLLSSKPFLCFFPGFCSYYSRSGTTLNILLSLDSSSMESAQLPAEAKPAPPHPNFPLSE